MLWPLTLTLALAGDCATVDNDQLVVAAPFAFATRSAELTDDTPVRAMHCALEQDPARTVQIEVHTDSMGSGTYNQRMSQQRADAIRSALLGLGVAPERVTAVGYGETMPIASNQSVEGRATNRRIELHLAPPSERPPPPQPATPQPAPKPVPPPPPTPGDLCPALSRAPSRLEPGQWTVPFGSDAVVAALAKCLRASWDVDADDANLHAFQDPWHVAVEAKGKESQVRLWRD